MNPSEHVGAVTVLAPPSVTMHLPARWRSERISKVGYLHRSMCSLVIYFVYLLHDCLCPNSIPWVVHPTAAQSALSPQYGIIESSIV